MTKELVRAGDLSADLPDIRGKLVLEHLPPKANERAPAAPKYKTTVTKSLDGTTKVTTEAVNVTPKPPLETISDALARHKRRVVDAQSRARYQEAERAKYKERDAEFQKTGRGQFIDAVLGGAIPVVKEHIDTVCTELLEHLAALETRIKELEKTPQLKWCGRWTESQYEPGSIVESGGSAWIAKRRTRSKPSPAEVETDWALFARRGRDGASK